RSPGRPTRRSDWRNTLGRAHAIDATAEARASHGAHPRWRERETAEANSGSAADVSAAGARNAYAGRRGDRQRDRRAGKRDADEGRLRAAAADISGARCA